MNTNHTLQGLIAATFTPMKADGSLALELIEPYAARLLRDGVNGLFVCGTTGEGASLMTAERTQVVERWVKVIAGQIPVVVHVGHTSVEESKTLARHAEKAGA